MKKRVLLSTLVLIALSNCIYGSTSIFDAYFIYNTGGGTTYTQANTFNSLVFDNPSSFILNGGQIKTAKCDGTDVTGGGLQYRMYLIDASPPTFSYSGGFSFKSNDGGTCGGDQTWEKVNDNVNLLSGKTPGIYTLEIYFESYTSIGNQNYNNGGNNFKATIIIYNKSNITTGNWNSAGSWTSGVPSGNQPVLIQNTHSITLDGDVSVSILKINSGGTFVSSDGSAKKLTITKSTSGTFTTLSNSGTWSNGTGSSTVVFTGAPSSGDAIHAISGTIPFQNITVNKTNGTSNVGVSFGTNSSVSGTLEIGSGGFVATAPPASFYGANAILKFNQGIGATYNVNAGDFSWSTTVVPNYITISSGTVNLNANRTASGNLLIDGGTLVLKDNTINLTIQGNWTRSSGTFTHNNGTVTLSGVNSGIINATGGATVYNLAVSKTGGAKVTLGSNLTVSNTLTISSEAIFEVSAGKALTVTGTLTNGAGTTGLVVKSGGSLITSSAIEATVERFLTQYNATEDQMYHLISSPVSAQAIRTEFVTTIPTTGHDFYSFNEQTNLWINSKASNGSWNDGFEDNFGIGKGYLVAYPADVTKNFAGTLNTYPSGTPLVLNCTNNVGQGNGWNLLGNPFSSAIDWTLATHGDGMDNALYYYDNASHNYMYYIKFPEGTVGSGQQYIPAMQGFMVHAKTTGTKTVSISNAARTHLGQNVYYKSANAATNILSLKVAANGYEDEAFIHFNQRATSAFDGEFDAYKLKSHSEKVPALYTIASDGSELAINGLPETASKSAIPVYFKTSLDGEYLLSVNLQNITSDVVYLTDNKLNEVQDLTLNPEYVFTASTTDELNRFTLSFGTLGLDKSNQSKLNVYSTTGKINISGVDGKAEILVRNMMGQVVMRNSVNGSTLQSLNTNKLPAGVYVVSVVSGKQTVSEKVVVK